MIEHYWAKTAPPEGIAHESLPANAEALDRQQYCNACAFGFTQLAYHQRDLQQGWDCALGQEDRHNPCEVVMG